MQSNQIAALMKPYKMLVSRHALSPTYRALELGVKTVRGCSPAAILETNADLGLKAPIYIDAAAFMAVMDSLPSGKEVELSVEDTSLIWKCGAAKGKMALMSVTDMPAMPETGEPDDSDWQPNAGFVKALRLGGMSCDSQALLSMGLYGVVIDRDAQMIYSSDNVTISLAMFDAKGMEGLPAKMTLTPEVIELVNAVIVPGQGRAWFDNGAIYYQDKHCRLYARPVPELKQSALDIYEAFIQADIQAKIPPEAIATFIKRAGAMAESRKQTSISVGAREGKLELIFAEGAAVTDELFLIEEKVPDMKPINLDGIKLARALGHINTAILDHMERQVLVLMGDDFFYLISGRK